MLLPPSPAMGERKLRVNVAGLLHSLVVNCLLSMCLNLIHSTTKRKKERGEEGKEEEEEGKEEEEKEEQLRERF